MTTSVVISIISVSFAILTWFVTFFTNNSKDDKKDIEARVAERTEMNCKLDMIGTNVLEIKNDVASTKADIKNLNERIVAVEQSCKSAHHRLDTMEGK